MNNIIEVKKLTKKYPSFTLNDIDLEIPKGIVMGLIGENGAGKTTLIKSLLNIINTDSGEVKILGKDNKKEESLIKEDIAVILDNSFFPEIITPNNIKNIMKNIYKTWDNKLFDKYLEAFKLPLNKQIKTMSTGMKKKLEIAVALSHHPKLLILDEPTSGLDPIVRSEILDIFEDFISDEEKSIIMSTHIISDLEHIADYITFIADGKIIFTKKREDILNNYGILKCSKEEFEKIESTDIVKYKKSKNDISVLIENSKNAKQKYKNLKIDKPTIEDVMVLYIKGEKR